MTQTPSTLISLRLIWLCIMMSYSQKYMSHTAKDDANDSLVVVCTLFKHLLRQNIASRALSAPGLGDSHVQYYYNVTETL